MSENARCDRIIRMCTKMFDLLDNEVEGDIDEFLSNVQDVFLVLTEFLHADIDYIEIMKNEGRECDKSKEAHECIETFYSQCLQTLSRSQTFQAYNEKNLSLFECFNKSPSLIDSSKE